MDFFGKLPNEINDVTGLVLFHNVFKSPDTPFLIEEWKPFDLGKVSNVYFYKI